MRLFCTHWTKLCVVLNKHSLTTMATQNTQDATHNTQHATHNTQQSFSGFQINQLITNICTSFTFYPPPPTPTPLLYSVASSLFLFLFLSSTPPPHLAAASRLNKMHPKCIIPPELLYSSLITSQLLSFRIQQSVVRGVGS